MFSHVVFIFYKILPVKYFMINHYISASKQLGSLIIFSFVTLSRTSCPMSLKVWCRINISVLVGPAGFILHQLENLLSEDTLALQTFHRIAAIWFYFYDILFSECLGRTVRMQISNEFNHLSPASVWDTGRRIKAVSSLTTRVLATLIIITLCSSHVHSPKVTTITSLCQHTRRLDRLMSFLLVDWLNSCIVLCSNICICSQLPVSL